MNGLIKKNSGCFLGILALVIAFLFTGCHHIYEQEKGIYTITVEAPEKIFLDKLGSRVKFMTIDQPQGSNIGEFLDNLIMSYNEDKTFHNMQMSYLDGFEIVNFQLPDDNYLDDNTITLESDITINVVIEKYTKNLIFDRNTRTIKGVTGDIGNLKLPNTIRGIHVVSIGEGAFAECQLTELNLSNMSNLISIEAFSFSRNSIRSLNLTGLLNLRKIGPAAFLLNNINHLDLSNLINLEIIGNSAFSNSKIVHLDLSGLTNLRIIDHFAFDWNQINYININNAVNLEEIGEAAFAVNQIADLNLSGLTKLTRLHHGAFYANQIAVLDLRNLPNLNKIDGTVFALNRLTVTGLHVNKLPSDLIINSSAFEGNLSTSTELSNHILNAAIFNQAK